MADYLLVPKPNRDEKKVSKYPNEDNGWIKKMRGGSPVATFEATESLLRDLPVKKPRDYMPKERLVTEDGVSEPLRLLPDGKLSTNIKPYHQLIYKIVQNQGGASFDDIYRTLAMEYKVIKISDFYEEQVEEQIDEMRDRALLFKPGREYKIGLEMKHEDMVDFERGYDPRKKKVEMKVRRSREGGTTYGEIKGLLMDTDKLGWVEKPENVEEIVKSMKATEVIKEEPEGWYKYVNPLEPIYPES